MKLGPTRLGLTCGMAAIYYVLAVQFPSPGQAEKRISPPDDLRTQLVRILWQVHEARLRAGQPVPATFDEIKPQLVQTIFAPRDYDGNGVINAADLEMRRSIEKTQRRAQFIQSKLQFDLNGDGLVTRAELAIALRPQAVALAGSTNSEATIAAHLETLITQELKLNWRRDGILTLDQIVAGFEANWQAETLAPSHLDLFHAQIMSLDRDNEGQVTAAKFAMEMLAIFTTLDKNGDGAVSSEELAPVSTSLGLPPHRPTTPVPPTPLLPSVSAPPGRPACNVPKAPAGGKLAFVGIYEGRGLSTVKIGRDETQTTAVTDVVIADGAEPLFVVLTSYEPTIWRFSGAVSRVSNVVVSAAGTRSRAGIIGISRDRVHITTQPDCVPKFYEPHKSAVQIKSIADAVARSPDVVAGIYGATTLQLPAGTWDVGGEMPGAMRGPDFPPAAKVWLQLRRFRPAGVIEIDPATVIAASEVHRYTVLPQQAGLAQLVASGAMTFLGDGKGMMAYRINRATQFPAGLYGAHSVGFVVGKDVPMPQGTHGHSCIVWEETGDIEGHEDTAKTCREHLAQWLPPLARP
jgi:Ca2+-binding EF-hand superfamily protein